MVAHEDSIEATETSPLLAASNGNGVTPQVNGAPPDGTADLERHDTTDSARDAQYKGDAESKKQLKWILPAVGVGTC